MYKAGQYLQYIAPAGGVRDGEPVLIGDEFVIPQHDAAEGEPFLAVRSGIVELPKGADLEFAYGAKAYWDVTNKVVTSVPTDYFIGTFYAEAPRSVFVLLKGAPSDVPAGVILRDGSVPFENYQPYACMPVIAPAGEDSVTLPDTVQAAYVVTDTVTVEPAGEYIFTVFSTRIKENRPVLITYHKCTSEGGAPLLVAAEVLDGLVKLHFVNLSGIIDSPGTSVNGSFIFSVFIT